MKLICPHCLKSVSVPEDAAGKDAVCPECGKSFPAPARYNPVVAPPPPPPPAAPPVAPPVPAASPTQPAAYVSTPPPGLVPTALAPPAAAVAPESPVPAGYTRSVGIVLSPRVVAWLPAVCLTVAFLLTFFPWVGSYFGDNAVYSQGPWRMVVKSVNRDYSLEVVASEKIKGFGAWLDSLPYNWELMLPFLLLLFAATLLAWADHFIAAPPPPNRLPPPLRWVNTIWPHRAAILSGLAAISLVLVLSQAVRGFGIESAVGQAVRNSPQLVEARQKAGGSAADQAKVDMMEQQELDKYRLRRTMWFYLSVGFHMLAVVGIAARAGLARRGNKPPPRIVIQY
jgi:hypothetical protein